MTDIVERLREHADTGNRPSQWPADMREAADEIERLDTVIAKQCVEIERLRAELERANDATRHPICSGLGCPPAACACPYGERLDTHLQYRIARLQAKLQELRRMMGLVEFKPSRE